MKRVECVMAAKARDRDLATHTWTGPVGKKVQPRKSRVRRVKETDMCTLSEVFQYSNRLSMIFEGAMVSSGDHVNTIIDKGVSR